MSQKKVDTEILRFLVENNQKAFSINEIAKKLQKDYKIIYETIKELPSINRKKSAGANLISFNFAFSELLFQVENKRRMEALKDKNLKVIYDNLYKLNVQFILLLFGSRAKKTHRKNSDYDLLLITDNPQKIESNIELYPLEIHLNTFTLEECKQMLLSKEFTVISEAVKNNIILFGIEDYYRLLQNAQ